MSKKLETDEKGIPLKGPLPDSPPIFVQFIMIACVMTSIGGFVTYFTIVQKNDAIEKLELLAHYDLGYLYVAVLLLKLGQLAMGINMATARIRARIHPPDQQVYKVKGAEGSKLGYVLMDYSGDNGKFNRAQRAIQNYNETFPHVLVCLVLTGFVYPKEVMIIAGIYSLTRLTYAVGYTSSADGRLGGFVISNIVIYALDSPVGMIAYKLLA